MLGALIAAVFAAVVIRQRHDPEPVEISHPRDVAGGHIVLRAGRQAGMDVQIAGELHPFFAGATPFS